MATKKKAAAKPKAATAPKAAKSKAPAVKAPAVKPLGDRILVKRVEARDIVKGGIIIPDSAKERPQEGIVVALGEGHRLKSGKVLPFDVTVGDLVVIEKYTGSEITIEGEEYTIIKEDGVLAVLEQ
ncbi:MAG: co-chaperone GroES [Verrucomicrobia bacterium]|nr:co-chaperone GroES [Verrucomicrobiota bacterium]